MENELSRGSFPSNLRKHSDRVDRTLFLPRIVLVQGKKLKKHAPDKNHKMFSFVRNHERLVPR